MRSHLCGVVSSWIWAERPADLLPEWFKQHGPERAERDLTDIRSCDMLVLEAEHVGRRAGSMWEAGYAQGIGKKIAIIGQSDCVFTTHPDILQFASWSAFGAWLELNPN